MRNLLKIVLVAVVLFASTWLPPLSEAKVLQEGDSLKFSAQIKELGLQNPSLERGKSPDDLAEVVLPGRIYEKPYEVAVIDQSQTQSSALEAIASVLSANKAGDLDWVVQNFISSEQDEIRKEAGQHLERNTAFFASVDKLLVIGECRYKQHDILLVQYRFSDEKTLQIPYVFALDHGKWKATNALKSDENFDVVFSAWRRESNYH